MLKKKIKGSSMLLAIVISLLIAMMLTAFMLIYQYNSFFIAEGSKTSELIHNINSVQLLIQHHADKFQEGQQSIDLFGEGNDSVDIYKQQWGLLDLWSLKAHSGRQVLSKSYLTGQQQSNDSLAIYLAGNNKPLALCGKTVIRGNVKLSKQGVKRAYIEGQNFVGNKLIQGKTSRSNVQLPLLQDQVKTRINFWSSLARIPEKSVLVSSLSELNIKKGSSDTLLLVKSDAAYNTMSIRKADWTIFFSRKSITVNSSSQLNNCIVIAPGITIEENFEGSIQCFATDFITIEKNARLKFPSNVILATQLPSQSVVIEEGARVEGALIIDMKGNLVQKNWPRLKLQKEALIMGQAYVNGRVEISGTIEGSLYTRLFYLKTPSSIYENHLLNVTIDRLALPQPFVNTFASESDQKLAIIECVK